jgi:hypothetical protein
MRIRVYLTLLTTKQALSAGEKLDVDRETRVVADEE